jgi:TPR repeat protein
MSGVTNFTFQLGNDKFHFPVSNKSSQSLIQLILIQMASRLTNDRISRNKIQRRVASRLAKWQFHKISLELLTSADALCLSGRCAEAAPLYRRSIYLGNTLARARLAWMLSQGREGLRKDEREGFRLIWEGSQLGCDFCTASLACFFQLGIGILADYTEMDHFLKLVKRPNEYSQFLLGILHYRGLMRRENLCLASLFFQRAAEKNFAEAFVWLGKVFLYDEETEYPHEKAFGLFMKAAEQGHPIGLFRVGKFLELDGKNDQAIMWYQRAHVAGHEYAEDIVIHLQNSFIK